MQSYIVPLILAVATLGPLATMAQSSPNNSTDGETGTLSPIYYLQFILANSLELGDSCSWSDEAFRQLGARVMKRYPKDSKPYDQAFDNIVSSTVENGRTYCLAKEMLVCDRDSQKCVCGESAVQASLGLRYKPSSYESEWDASTGKKVCRFSRGASCDPQTAPKRQASFVPKCAQGLTCTYLKDGTSCTNLSTLKYVLDAIRNNVTREEAMDGILTGKMCQCVSEEDNGLDNDEFAVTSNNGRFRRSVGRNGDDIYARAKATLFTPGTIEM